MITLTGNQIINLAEIAGFKVTTPGNSATEKTSLWEAEYYIGKCPKEGILNPDNGKIDHPEYIVSCDGCDDGEATPI